MLEAFYQTAAAYRRFDGETLAVQLETGDFFYFSSNTESFFDFFRHPRSLDQFLESAGIAKSENEECRYLINFFGGLVDNKLFKESSCGLRIDPASGFSYSRPVLLRKAERRLEDLAGLWGISGPNTSQSGI